MFGKHDAGIYEKAFDAKINWAERLQRAKSLGFDYVEISIDESDERLSRLDWSKGQKKQLVDDVWDSGVQIRSMCLSAHRRFPFGSKDASIRQRAKDIMDKAIDFAGELDIRVIQLAGYDVYYEQSTPDSVKRFFDGMNYSADRAEKAQVMLAMEIMDTPFMNSITKHLEYEKKIHSPWFKVYPDIGNLSAWQENNPKEELEKGIDSIVAIHLKDTISSNSEFKGQFKGVEFGKGCVDFVQRFKDLNRLNYNGPYMIEMWHKDGTDDVKEIKKAIDFLVYKYQRSFDKC